LKLLIRRLRERWPDVKIMIRGDSSFCQDQARSPPPWPGAAPPRGRARGPGTQVSPCAGGLVRPRYQTRSKLPLKEKPCPPIANRHP
jgi:hypothetical protein